MGNLSCGNLDPPPSSGGQSAASSPSAPHEDGLTKRFRRCRSPFREPPKSDRHPVGTLIAIARNTHLERRPWLRCTGQGQRKPPERAVREDERRAVAEALYSQRDPPTFSMPGWPGSTFHIRYEAQRSPLPTRGASFDRFLRSPPVGKFCLLADLASSANNYFAF